MTKQGAIDIVVNAFTQLEVENNHRLRRQRRHNAARSDVRVAYRRGLLREVDAKMGGR